MYHHMILMCSDFTSGSRIAFHKSYKEILDAIKFKETVSFYKKEYETIKFSFHHVETAEESYISVGEYDNYFEDVNFYSDAIEFEEHIRKSIKITPEDIAKYILTKGNFDKLQLQKLVFLAYSQYAAKYDEPLFEDNFEAWPYGPVMPRLHNKLDNYKREKIKYEDVDLEKLKLKLKLSKVDDSKTVLECVDSVISEYGDKTGGQLVDITHAPNSPWDIVKSQQGLRATIPWELVKECERV
ncbi:MAG: Panacea domain-containing protein [Romboutsia sp.]